MIRQAMLWLVWSPRRLAGGAAVLALIVAFSMSLAAAGSLSALLEGRSASTAAATAAQQQEASARPATDPAAAASQWMTLYLAPGPDKADWTATLSPLSTNRMVQYLLSVDTTAVPDLTVQAAETGRTDNLSADAVVSLSDGTQVDVTLLLSGRGSWLVDAIEPRTTSTAEPTA